MEKSKSVAYICGGIFVLLGIFLLVTLLNVFSANSVYRTVLPLVFIVAGFSLFSTTNTKKQTAGLGLGLLLLGVVMILVRYDVITGRIVNGILGIVVLLGGILFLSSIAEKTTNDKA